LSDNAETVLHRLLRGTGFRGLGGIRPVQVFDEDIKFVRPLLCVRRDEIVEYLKERSLKWQVDHTNYDCTYRRNFIRHRLMPALQQECTRCLVEGLFELSQSAQRFYSLVCSRAEQAWPEVAECENNNVMLDARKFSLQPLPVRVELIRRGLAAIGSGEGDLTQAHFETVLQLAKEKAGGKRVELPGGFVVCREYEKLTFGRIEDQQTEEQTCQSVEIEIPGRTTFGNYLIEATVLKADVEVFEKFKVEKSEFIEWFDLDKVKPPLVVRFRQPGDRFWPLGLAGVKKVGKFLTTAKIPHEMRRKVLIVTDAEKTIWLWPIRISEQARINDRTRNILQLQIIHMPGT
jgi:tRNA(Ile)-lysidine synthase